MSDHDDHHDDRDRITSLADDMTKRTSAPETAHDSPMLQARVRIPDGTDRRQWLKQQSKSRKQKRRSSGDAKRTPSSSSPNASGETLSNHRSLSQDSSQGGDESDTSCSSSVMSGLSIVSTPEPSRRQRQIKELRFSVEHAASEVGSPDRSGRSRVPPSFNAPSPTPSAAAAAAAAGRARRTISRTSSSSSSLSMLGSSSWMRWCSVCEAEFTKLRRPHRCRRCLEAVCASCSPARLPVPGMANPELKRTCRLCAGGSRAPQLDDALTRYRPQLEPAATAADATAGASSGSIRRSNSVSGMMGGIINRAPLGVLSDVAGVVKAGLYPGAPGAADGAGGAPNTGGGGSTGDPLGDDVGVTTPGGSLRKRLSAGGAAALGAIGAGISLAGDRSFRRRGSSVGSASDRPSGTEADADGGSGEPSGGEVGVTTPGGSLRKRLSAGGAAAWGAIGAGIGLSGDRSSRRRDDSAGSASELSAGVDVDVNGDSADLYSSEVGVTTPGGSLRKRLSAGGAAAWGAIGVGIRLSGDRSSRKRGDSAGSAGEPPAGVEGDVDYGSGDLYSSEVGVTTPGGSIRKRLSAGGAAAWDAIGAGIGTSGDKSIRKRDDSAGSAGELSAGIDYDEDDGSSDPYGSEVGVTTPSGSIRKRLSAGGAAAWGVVGTGIGRLSGKSPGEEGGAAAGAADTEPRFADGGPALGIARKEEMDELEEVHTSAVNKRAVKDADDPPVRRTNAELSLAARIAIGGPTATAAGKERPAELKASDDGQSAPTQQEATTSKPPLHSTAAAVEGSDDQAAASGADEAPLGNGEDPQSEQATVVVVGGGRVERAEGKAVTVEGSSIEDVIENTAGASGDVLVEASRGGAEGGDGVSNAPELEERAMAPKQPLLATSDASSASPDKSHDADQMSGAAASVEEDAVVEAPIIETIGAEGDAPVDVPSQDTDAINEKVEVPAEAERVEEAEQPPAVTPKTIVEAKDELPEGGGVLEVVAPAEDGAIAEAPIDNATFAGGTSPADAPPEDAAMVEVPVVSARETGELARAEAQATPEVAVEAPLGARGPEAVAPPKDGAVVEAPLENTTGAGDDAPVDASSEGAGGTDDNVDVPVEAKRAEEVERPAPAVTPEIDEVAADEPPERGEAVEVVGPAEDDGVTEASINTATGTGSDTPTNALPEAAEATEASVAQDRTAPFASEALARVAEEVPQAAQTPEAAASTKDCAVVEAPVETTDVAGDNASANVCSKGAEGTDDTVVQMPVEAEQVEEVEEPALATSGFGSQAADVLPEKEEVLGSAAPAEDGAVPEAPSNNNTTAGGDAPLDAPPGSAVTARVPAAEGRAGETEIAASVMSVSVSEAAQELPEDGETLRAVTPVEEDDVIAAPTAHDAGAGREASVNAPSDVASGVDDAVGAATMIGRTGEAEEPAPVSSEAAADGADELSENTTDADGKTRLDPEGAAADSDDAKEVQVAEGQIGKDEQLLPVAPEAVTSVVDGLSDEEEWTEVVAPVEHDPIAGAPSDVITGAGDNAADIALSEIPSPAEEGTTEKGAVEAKQHAPDAPETVAQVAAELLEVEETEDVVTPVDDDTFLGEPIDDTAGAGGDTPIDESPEHPALNDEVAKVSMVAGGVGDDEQSGPIASGLPLEVADDSPGVGEAAEAATLAEGDVVADELIGTSFFGPVSETAAAAAAAAAVAAAEEPQEEKTAEEAEQPAPVASGRVSEAPEEFSEVGGEASEMDPTESGAESDAPIGAPAQTAMEVPVVDERASQAEETGPAASEAVSGASGDSFEDEGRVQETTAPQEDDAVAEAPVEETVEEDAPVAAPPEVDVAEEERSGDIGHPASVSSMPILEVRDELSGEGEMTHVEPPTDDGVVADAPLDDDTGAGAETPEDAPPFVATGGDDVAERPQEARQACEAEQPDPSAPAISSDAAGDSPEAGEVPDDTVPVEDDAGAEATIHDNAGAEGDEPVDASSEATPAAEKPVAEEEEEQAMQPEQRSTIAPEAEIGNELPETAEIVEMVTSVGDGVVVGAAIEGDASSGYGAPVDAPPEVETVVEGRAVEGGQPEPVASEPRVGVRDDLPEREGDSPAISAPVDDDVVADAPTSDNGGVEGETPVDARAEIADENEGAAEDSMTEETTGDARQPAPITAEVGGEVADESPGVQESTGVVAPVEDNAVAGVPTDHVSGAGVDEPVDSPSEAAATTEAPPVVEEQAVHTEQQASVPSEVTSEVADEVLETAEVTKVDATTVEDDTIDEAPVQAGASAEGDAPVDVAEEVDVTAEMEFGEAEQLHALASAPIIEIAEKVLEEGRSPEAVAPMDADDAVADAPTKETPGAEGEAPLESLPESTAGVDDVAEVSSGEEPTEEPERPVLIAPAAAREAVNGTSEVGGSAEISAPVEDGAVVDAPADSVNSDAGDAPVDVRSEATTAVEVPVVEEHGVQAEQIPPVASGDVMEVADELSEKVETARGSATVEDDAEDDAIDEEPIEDGASAGEHAPVDFSAETDGMAEERVEQAEQPFTVASAPPAEVAGESPEGGGSVEIVVPVRDDAVADEATDDVTGAEGDAPVDAPPEAAAIAVEVPASEVLPVRAKQPAPVASDTGTEAAPEPSEAGDVMAAATAAGDDESVSEAANDNVAGDGGDVSDSASPENDAVIEEMVTGVSGDAEPPASTASDAESVTEDELHEGNVAAGGDAALDSPPDVTNGVDEPAAVERVGEAKQPALTSELPTCDAEESSEAGGMLEDVAIVGDETIAEEPAEELSEDKAGSQAGEPIEATPDAGVVDHHKVEVPSTTQVREGEEPPPVAAEPLSDGAGELTEDVGGALSDAPATSAAEIKAEKPASAAVGEVHEKENGEPLPAELAELAAATAGGHAERITADTPVVAAEESPAAARELVSRPLEDYSAPKSEESEVSPALRESSSAARAASAEIFEVDEASRVDAGRTSEETPGSARDAEGTAPVASPEVPLGGTDSAPEMGGGGEEVVAVLEDDDVPSAPVEPMREATSDASTSLESVPVTSKEASEETDSAPAIAGDVDHSGEAEPATTADPSTGGTEKLPEDGDARPAPTPDNGDEAVMTAGGEDAAPLELEGDSLEEQLSSADADSSPPGADVKVPVRAKSGEADSGDPDEAGDSATAVVAAGMDGESTEGVVPTAVPGGSSPPALDTGAPAQSADEDGSALASTVEDADAVTGRSGAESSAHGKVAADASAASTDDEASASLDIDGPSAVSTEDARKVADGVLVQGSAPAAKGQKSAAAGAEDFAAATAEGVVEAAAENPAPLASGDVPTAAPPDLDAATSIPGGTDDKSDQAGGVPTSGGSTKAQEATAATSSESEPPPSSLSQAKEGGAEARAAAAIDDTRKETKAPHPPTPRDARGAPSDRPAEVKADDERIRASPKAETEASVPAAAAEEGLEQTLEADPQSTDPREAFELCGQGLLPVMEDQASGDTVKWFRFRAMPSDEPNTVAASVAFFLFFFAFVACLRSSDH